MELMQPQRTHPVTHTMQYNTHTLYVCIYIYGHVVVVTHCIETLQLHTLYIHLRITMYNTCAYNIIVYQDLVAKLSETEKD